MRLLHNILPSGAWIHSRTDTMLDDPKNTTQPTIVSNQQFVDYIAHQAAQIADEKAVRRENTYRTLFGVTIGVLAFLGYSNWSSLEENLESRITSNIQQQNKDQLNEIFRINRPSMVNDAIAIQQGKVDAKLALIQFSLIARDIDQRPNFSPSERDAAISLIKDAIKLEEVQRSPEFTSSLEKIVDAFFSADLSQDIDSLDDALGGTIVDNKGIVITLTQHYGRRVLGDAQLSDKTITRFQKYARASHRLQFPEAALPYQIAFSFKQNNLSRNPETSSLFDDAKDLNPDEIRNFIGLMISNQEEAEEFEAKSSFKRIADIFSSLMETYSDEIVQLTHNM